MILSSSLGSAIFFQTEIDFIGQQASTAGISIQEGMVEVVQRRPVPRIKSNVSSFLGMANYHQEVVMGYAEVAQPLYKLIPLKATFSCTAVHQQAFEKLSVCPQHLCSGIPMAMSLC